MAPKKKLVEQKDYLNKPDYGKIPSYISTIKSDIKKEYEYIRNLRALEEEQTRAKVRMLPDEEKNRLIDALKAKWERVNADYQQLTHVTDLRSLGKIRRKTQYEAQLSEIEKDIAKLSRGYIFVDQTQ